MKRLCRVDAEADEFGFSSEAMSGARLRKMNIHELLLVK